MRCAIALSCDSDGWIEMTGYLASALVFAAFCMKTMTPLRVAAISSNVAFIIYAFYDDLYPVLILHFVLLPLNVLRTAQMLRFKRRVERAANGDFSADWLRSFMKITRRKAGEIIFSRGDYADRLYMILGGDVLLEQISIVLHVGDVFGEMGLFSADRQRTQTARALSDVELLWISDIELAQVCYKNPEFAFYFLRLATNRLIANASPAEVLSACSAGSKLHQEVRGVTRQGCLTERITF
jgi:CRP/FNR family cyclic AMP-dependent transcriptional regulator